MKNMDYLIYIGIICYKNKIGYLDNIKNLEHTFDILNNISDWITNV